jgi:hypothetical protein
MSDLNSRPFFPRPTVRFSRQAGVLPRVFRVLSRHIQRTLSARLTAMRQSVRRHRTRRASAS